jgi:hypothetical protein
MREAVGLDLGSGGAEDVPKLGGVFQGQAGLRGARGPRRSCPGPQGGAQGRLGVPADPPLSSSLKTRVEGGPRAALGWGLRSGPRRLARARAGLSPEGSSATAPSLSSATSNCAQRWSPKRNSG